MRPVVKQKFEGFDAICLAGLLLVVLFAYIGLCWTKSQQVRHYSRLTREISKEVEEMGSVRAALEREQKMLEKLKVGLVLLHRRIPNDPDIDGFLKDLHKAATRQNVLIEGIRPGETIERGSYLEAPIAIEASAQFRDFFSFVAELGDMPRLATVEDIEIQADAGQLCRIDLTLKVYAYGKADYD